MAALEKLVAKDWREDFEDDLATRRAREITPGPAPDLTGGTLASDMLPKTGDAFALAHCQTDEYCGGVYS